MKKIDKILKIISIAFRNLWRNKRRSSITFGSIIIACIALLLAGGYINYTFWGLREQTIHSDLGHLQIYKKGYLEQNATNPYAFLLNNQDYDQVVSVLKDDSMVQVITRRLEFTGLASNGEKNVVFLGTGVEPAKEEKIGTAIYLIKGHELREKDQFGIAIGKNLAESLGLTVGDSITLLTTTVYGSINAIDFNIINIFSTGIKEFDERAIRINLPTAQSLLDTRDICKIVIGLYKTEDTKTIYNLLKTKLDKNNFDILEWLDMAQFYKSTVNLFSGFFNFFKVIIFIIVTLSILNTLTMSVMERTVEIGTMRAIGTKKRNIMFLFLTEGFLIGGLGAFFGIIAGIVLAQIINFCGGVPMPAPPGHTTSYSILIKINMDLIVTAFVVSVLAALISTIFPVLRAVRMKVVDALGHI